MFNRNYIFKWWIFHCHVSFRGGVKICLGNFYVDGIWDKFTLKKGPNIYMCFCFHLTGKQLREELSVFWAISQCDSLNGQTLQVT